MRWKLHGVIIEGTADHATIVENWRAAFASLAAAATEPPDLTYRLALVDAVPEPPAGQPDFRQGDLLAYYLDGETAVAHLLRFGQLTLELGRGRSYGRIVPAALATYGVLEDLLAIGLSPHLRRRGLFLVHAFAAAWNGRAALLVGGIGAGKTTTGLALLSDGWRLLANDSPILTAAAEALSYPGLLAAYPDSLARFPATEGLAAAAGVKAQGRPKVSLAAESIWPGVWLERAPLAAVLFPHVAGHGDHRLERLSPAETLRRLLPHAVEQWDRPMIAAHLAALRRAAEVAPGYALRLGPDVAAVPALLRAALD